MFPEALAICFEITRRKWQIEGELLYARVDDGNQFPKRVDDESDSDCGCGVPGCCDGCSGRITTGHSTKLRD